MAFTDWQHIRRLNPGGIALLPNIQSWGYTVAGGEIRYGIQDITFGTNNGQWGAALIPGFQHNNYINLSHDHQVDMEARIYTNLVAGPTNSGPNGVLYGAFIGCWAYLFSGGNSYSPVYPGGFLACYERRSLPGNVNSMSEHLVLRGWNSQVNNIYWTIGGTLTSQGVLGITSLEVANYHTIRLVATPITLSQKLLQVYHGGSLTPILSYVVDESQTQWCPTGRIVFGYYFAAYGANNVGPWHPGEWYNWEVEETRYPRLGFDYVNFNVTKYLSS